jgi:hypothetical protein
MSFGLNFFLFLYFFLNTSRRPKVFSWTRVSRQARREAGRGREDVVGGFLVGGQQ